jgi:hypothetical protein
MMDDSAQIIPWTPKGEAKTTPPEGYKTAKPSSARMILSSAEFIRGFVPPDYLIDGVLQRRFCYSFTARTGTGKTAVMLRIAAHVALGRELGDRLVAKGKVIYFAGENPDDIRMRWTAMSQQMDFDLQDIDVYFIPGTFKISAMRARIEQEIRKIGDVALIIVDTSAAFFEGRDENSNTEQAAHARLLRSLCEMPGGPCALIACHPPKNAGDDNLMPRGGGAFLAEVDGNLIARKEESGVTVNWQGKFRGPDFADMLFGLQTVTHQLLKDSRGRLIPTVVARPIGEIAQEEMAAAARSQEDELLKVVVQMPGASWSQLATALGWKLADGKPNKTRVSRGLAKLEKAKLIAKERDGYSLTAKGEKAVANLKPFPSKGSDD